MDIGSPLNLGNDAPLTVPATQLPVALPARAPDTDAPETLPPRPIVKFTVAVPVVPFLVPQV